LLVVESESDKYSYVEISFRMKLSPLQILSIAFTILFLVLLVNAEVSVGVEKGDWVEYTVTYTGSPDEMHAISWAKMEIESVVDSAVQLKMTTRLANGTLLRETATLNLQEGRLGDDFIIPANLNVGYVFYDRRIGNITIQGVEQGTYAGARRTVVYSQTTYTLFYWDKATGVVVEAKSVFPDYTMHTIATKTNMWMPQEEIIMYVLAALGITTLLIALLLRLKLRKTKRKE